jgi:hypothetical protein
MAAFVLWGRIQQISGVEFVAIAAAVCSDGSSKGVDVAPHIRPHDSLGSLPPAKYREKITAEQSSLQLST